VRHAEQPSLDDADLIATVNGGDDTLNSDRIYCVGIELLGRRVGLLGNRRNRYTSTQKK